MPRLLLAAFGCFLPSILVGNPQAPLEWERLPAIPDAVGFAGSYAGVSQEVLLVAGGANFPDRPPWEGGTKTWHDRIYALEPGAPDWREGGRLPQPAGYGLSLSTPEGVLLIGGGDASRNFPDVLRVRWNGRVAEFETLPALPLPLAMQAGALLGRTVYVAGGLDAPTATKAQSVFLALNLDNLSAGWKTLEPWPGPARMLATAGAQDGSFFLFGGADLEAGADGRPVRRWLRDAYRFTPGTGWRRLADLPHPSVAAPSPAASIGSSHLLVLGGDDGSQLATPPQQHPGFPRLVQAYHTTTDTWANMGDLPFSLVTTPGVTWNGRIIVPGGESRPGVRSTEVWAGRSVRRQAVFGWVNYTTLGIYPLIMLGIAWLVGRKRTSDEFFRGGQRIPWWAAGLSIYATMLSSITFMAIPAKSYATDWTFFLANVPVLLLAPVVIAVFLPFFRRLNITSAYEYLEQRFNLAARWFGSASFIVLQLGRTAIVLYLPALALATVSNFDMRLCILIMGVICVLMTFGGGIESVVWTDVAQTVILLVGALVTLIVAISHLPGGTVELLEIVRADAKGFAPLQWNADLTIATGWVILIGNAFSNLISYTASQDIVQRYVTTPDSRAAARSIWTNALMVLPSTALFFAVGSALYAFYKTRPDRLDPAIANDAIFPLFIVNELPAGLGGLVVAGIFAAAQPTSSLNSIATAWVTDFHARLKPTLSEASRLRIARNVTVLSGLAGTAVALLMTTMAISSIWDTFLGLVGLTGGALAGLFVLGVISKRAHGQGAMIGAATSVIGLYYVQQHTRLHFFLYAAIGIITCVTVGWLASFLLPRRSTK